MTAGLIVGLFSFPIELAVLMILITAGLFTPPEVPEISMDLVFLALVATLVMQVIGGLIGGLLGAALRRPTKAPEEAGSKSPIAYQQLPRSEKYCIQCGAGLAKTVQVCHACGAKQPS